MKFPLLIALSAILTAPLPLYAQTNTMPTPEQPEKPAARLASVLNVDVNNLAQLPMLLPRAGAVSLGVYRAELEANSAARNALLRWVQSGGTVFLHTDAAQLFGYRTVAAREGTARLAGQLYGRARAAVPFGAVPLLWDDGKDAIQRPVRTPGINTVFYTLRAGDDLVVDHPAGTPLLEVVDLAAPSNRPLYAAAIAPFGAGWAVFTPDTIDQRRADGAAFARNLLKLVGDSRYVGVSQAAIANGDILSALQRALMSGGGASAPLPGLGTDGVPVAREGTMTGTPVANDAPVMGDATVPTQMAPQTTARTGPVLLLTRAEAAGVSAALQADPNGRGAAALAILRARVALLNGDPRTANTQLALAERAVPQAGEIPFLRGSLAVGSLGYGSQLTSMQRAQAANLAANSFAGASRASSFLTQSGVTTANNQTLYGDINGAQLGALGAQINRLSQVLALEPPLSRVVGNGASAVTIRFFEGETTLPFVERAVTELSRSNLFGWNVDGQEILLFPTPAIYANYRAAAGLTQQNVPLPAAAAGDVVDNRILMVSIPPARPISRLPNGQVRVLPLRATTAALLARFESYALLQSYIGEGGGRVPGWMALGLEVLADVSVNGDTQSGAFNEELQRFAAKGGLLAPNQFNGEVGEASLLAQAQSLALMRYFYSQFGPGRVAETVQRLGAGESTNDALLATTGLNEIGFFRAWRQAQFGDLALRNR